MPVPGVFVRGIISSMVILIPCRWDSSRFPGKAIAPILGKPSIWWTCAACAATGYRTILLTDDERIADAVADLDVQVEYVREPCENGTERCSIYANRAKPKRHYMIVAGDEVCVQAPWLVDFAEAMQDEPLGTMVGGEAYYSYALMDMSDGYILSISRWQQPGCFEASGIYWYDNWNLCRYNQIPGGQAIELNRMLDFGAECKGHIEMQHPGLTLNYPDDVEQIEKWMQ